MNEQQTLPHVPAAQPVAGPRLTPQIAKNLLILLQKTPVVGMESFAFAEAYAALQVLANSPDTPA